MRSKIAPDLEARPATIVIEKHMKSDAHKIFKAWTVDFDLWFAEPKELIMSAEIDKPFFFYNRRDWGRHAHYGRFLEIEQDRLVEMTWLTGNGGTFGAETVIRIELLSQAEGTLLRLVHSGFEDELAAKAHQDNWPIALNELDLKLATSPK